MIDTLDTALRIAAGLGLGAYQVAWSRHLEASGAWLSTVPVWGAQLGIAAGVCAAGLLAAFGKPLFKDQLVGALSG